MATKKQHEDYMKLVGELLWVASQTRPDIAFLVMRLSQHTKAPTVEDLFQANFVLCRVKRDTVVFKYKPVDLNTCFLLSYSDAAWANLDSGKTGGGYLIGVAAEDRDTYGIIGWRCRALRRVVRSTMAGETLALGDLLDEAEAVCDVWKCVMGRELRATAVTDCRSLYDHIHLGKQVTEKRLRCELFALREAQKEKTLEVEWADTKQQLADSLTKSMVAHRLIQVINNGSLRGEDAQGRKEQACTATVQRARTPVTMGFRW